MNDNISYTGIDVFIDERYIPSNELKDVQLQNKKMTYRQKHNINNSIKLVSQDDIDESPDHKYIIDEPGSYVVIENLFGGIIIDASDVKLDFYGYTMRPSNYRDETL